ncbi:PQQ-binding-like beta-propeller repeat protein [Haladaptatus sp. DYF46]|uniref:outer membrane protein assembly factor BamB family protein n=1 Tax=Haladaptatus sp. DYF46 TaxID=2886041 RepID=UPI001E312C30|nr:PQQ-binding-like beta-propeller repeat protein [Haladaptatus sp. DYF46]
MRRRAFLAAGGLALGAGCSGLVGDSKKEESPPPKECAIDPSVTPGTSGWPSASGGAKNTRSVPSADAPAPPLELDWTFTTGGHVAAPEPVVVNGTVYATNYDDEVHAVNAATGEHRWRVNIPVDSRVAVAGNRLFVVSDASLCALDTKDGEEVWTTESTAESSPLSGGIQATDDTVFVFGSLYLSAFDAATGERRWRFSTGLRIESSPAIADGVVYAGNDDTYVYALDAVTGERKWRYKTDGRVSCDTAVADGVVHAGSEDGHLYTLDAKTGDKRWKRRAGSVEVIAVDGGHVYTGGRRGDNSTLHSFTAETGTACWSADGNEMGYSRTIAASSDGIYLSTEFFSGGNTLGVLNPQTGERVWRDEESNMEFQGGLAVADGAVYVGGWNDSVLSVARFVPKD